MRSNGFKLCLFVLMAVLYTNCAYADGDIFDSLASKAGTIGSGLKDTGYVIAALGLIAFSFMAIFNKISWKTLAYIMMSCFLLSAMTALINFVKERDGGTSDVQFSNNNGSATPTNTNPQKNPVSK